jgi:hypothetical protein
LAKGIDAEAGLDCVGTELGGQNKICPTVAFAESYLFYIMIIDYNTMRIIVFSYFLLLFIFSKLAAEAVSAAFLLYKKNFFLIVLDATKAFIDAKLDRSQVFFSLTIINKEM